MSSVVPSPSCALMSFVSGLPSESYQVTLYVSGKGSGVSIPFIIPGSHADAFVFAPERYNMRYLSPSLIIARRYSPPICSRVSSSVRSKTAQYPSRESCGFSSLSFNFSASPYSVDCRRASGVLSVIVMSEMRT